MQAQIKIPAFREPSRILQWIIASNFVERGGDDEYYIRCDTVAINTDTGDTVDLWVWICKFVFHQLDCSEFKILLLDGYQIWIPEGDSYGLYIRRYLKRIDVEMQDHVVHRRPDWMEFKKVLDAHGITKLYHFTDRANLESIKQKGGLYSWEYCEQHGIEISRPGGNELSRNLDKRYGLQDFVRLSFHNDLPMLHIARQDGRIVNPVMLQVDPEVVFWESTQFCDGNATAKIAKTGDSLGHLNGVRFDIINGRRWADDLEMHYIQAEVLVRTHVPALLIRNLP